MPEPLYALVLGIIQGLTEFLPVSSSGHLILVSWYFSGEALPIELNIALHCGTLTAVLIYFWRDWWSIIRGTLGRVTGHGPSFESDTLLPALLIGSVPAGVVGLLYEDKIEALFHNPWSVALPLAVVGILLWYGDRKSATTRSLRQLRLQDSLLIGIAQATALIPGVSRSGATILGGRLLGFGRQDAARFSFLLGTPAMGGAALLKGSELWAYTDQTIFWVGLLTSLVTGCLAINVFLRFLRRFGFAAFAIYRVILGGLIFLLMY